MTVGASKDELAESIAAELGHLKIPAILRGRLREYHIAATDLEKPQQQREQLRAIEQTCLAAAKALGLAPQEVDWFPKGIATSSPPLTKERIAAIFIDNLRKAEQSGNVPAARFLRQQFEKFESGELKLEQEGTEPLIQAVIGPTVLSVLLKQVSETAGQAADRLPRLKGKEILAKDAAAYYGWLLIHEFYQEPGKPSIESKNQPRQTATEYVKANWTKLSPEFRKVQNRYRQLKGLRPIPDPKVDLYAPPTRVRKPRFPWGNYLVVTAFFSEYMTGKHEQVASLETACRKVAEKYERVRKRR
jgi:hypothetical protein